MPTEMADGLRVPSPLLSKAVMLLLALQVKMRDVLSLVNSILCANSLALALSEGVPAVLQQHLDAMQQQVTQQLAPAGQGGTAAAQLHGQVRRVVLSLTCCCC
jgi:hypothetical protein